ncbi:hypothetical protein MWU52_04540 [Jannaschia sp. S6380]|uniref:calcium-binding protein n=1 Tax=Jannaschia sp. S6380 TaxID=2926408 RepID=UPI001FF3638F|nr:calcium-binding protein [Jannaschia sp. S6380]MCK0166813.1 hypothetical protein [Jannaschia sp. S6380]
MNRVFGTDQDDILSGTSGGVFAGGGNDILNVTAQRYAGQIHSYGGSGDDVTNMSFHNILSFSHGHHSRGGSGHDVFNFQSLDEVNDVVVGRIEDFDPSEDELQIDGVELDLYELPENVHVVLHNGVHNDPGTVAQQWLLINTGSGSVFYALEGARIDMDGDGLANFGDHEAHFLPNAPDFSSMTKVDFIDPKNFVPSDLIPDGGVTINDTDVDRDDVLEGIEGSADGDLIAAGLNDDFVDGNRGSDKIWGGSGNDSLNGSAGDDTIEGGTGNDVIRGGNDMDSISGLLGDDVIRGNDGDDEIDGGSGNDFLRGGSGVDRLWGGEGSDELYGDAADDVLHGGSGNDQLRGGAGRDRLEGGSGADVFDFRAGDLVDWGGLEGEEEEKLGQLDLVEDFVVGVDSILFRNHQSIVDRGDLSAFKTYIGNDAHFTIRVRETNERILVDVAEDVNWSDFFNDDNFDFL